MEEALKKVRSLKMDSPEGAIGRKNKLTNATFLKMDSQKGQLDRRRAFKKRSRSMNGVAVRDGELILWGMKAMV